jgi:PAS domain S-box-containing protein
MNNVTQYTSKKHLFHLIDHTPNKLSFVDHDYIYRAVNQAYVKTFNRSYGEIIGYPIAEILGNDVFENLIKPHIDRALRGEEVTYEAWFDFIDADRVYQLVRYHPIYEKNKIIGVVVSATDITAHKQLEDEKQLQVRLIAEQKRMVQLGEMIAFIAHQWRRPLHTLSTYLLRIRLEFEKYSCGCVDKEMNRSEEILEHLSQNLESLHQFHSNEIGWLSIKISFQEVKHLLESHLNVAQITMKIDIPEELMVNTEIPSSRLLHLFSVFIENAIEALEKVDRTDKKINVRGWEDREAIYVDISDNGDGIALEQAKKVFQAGVSTKSGENHGYGLYFAQKILIEQLEGSVELIPNEIGAWFRLTFPKLRGEG